MAGRSRDFDNKTDVQPDPPGYARAVVRRRPTLRWQDADGSHAMQIASRTVIGSRAGVDLVVGDPSVSRLHAELDVRDDGLWVRDLGSRNGTFIEGIQVVQARIPERSRLRVGGTDIVVDQTRAPERVDLWPDDRFGALTGAGAAMRELFARLARVAAAGSTVLIHGETGTGKELTARAIHEASARAAEPYIVVDCAALPEQLLEAELFGHARGAFTGAQTAREGAIESAHGGSVFLDEVGELPLAMQPKLLRVLESRAVRRVGETHHRQIDVRFIAATHRDLREMVNAGAFREDLYFRLAVLPVTVPPLREHPEDIPLLVAQFAPQGRAGELDPLLPELMRRPWLGNVRELRNVVERALTLGTDAALQGETGLSAGRARTAARGATVPDELLELPFAGARERWIEAFEREYIRALLVRHRHNVSAVADAADVHRTYVHRLIRRHGL